MLFGGELWDGQVSAIYDDLFVYNTKKHTWSQITSGKGPSPRSSSQGFTYKQYLFIHGGEYASRSQSQFVHFKDVFRFDVNQCIWEELPLKGGPSSRSGHRIVPWKKSAIAFGGFYDNALETRYFNDVWILSQLDTVGSWTEVTVPTHNDAPHPRSGHCLGMHEDTLFVYGGYSTEKASRFKRAEATVHHDLWCMNLAGLGVLGGAPVVWQRIKMAGIPPPIRSAVSTVTYGKRMLLFGGVVDLDSTGGKTVSTFYNDLFAFHMDSKRFFPMVLQKPKKPLKNVILSDKKAGDSSSSSSESGGSDAELEDELEDADIAETAKETSKEIPKVSYEQNQLTLQVTPFKRMDAMLCVDGHTLYVYGGLLEEGKKEITMNDLFSINMNRMETYEVHHSMNLSEATWLAEESGSEGAGSWETNSTVMSEDYMGRSDEEDEELDDPSPIPANVDLRAALANSNNDELEDETEEHAAPDAVPMDDIPLGRTTVKGKKGMKLHKEQLESQLGSKSSIPTPLTTEEPFKEFYTRTEDFWIQTSLQSFAELQESTAASSAPLELSSVPEKDQRRIKIDSQRFARLRYNEATELMKQLAIVEERQKEEVEYFAKLREAKKKYEEEAAARAAAEEDEENEESEDEEA
eukprot:GILJ01015180.1.p1 GENE.GILJ01015180.1~~GILJ01015180.1.p1  ORF type:complete len:635 (-),score=137.41 GILJ01015180.1:43-1947(-)